MIVLPIKHVKKFQLAFWNICFELRFENREAGENPLIMKHFKGKSEAMSLKLPKYLKSSRVSRLSLGYGVHLNNAVKKSSQLFNVVFKNNRPSNN